MHRDKVFVPARITLVPSKLRTAQTLFSFLQEKLGNIGVFIHKYCKLINVELLNKGSKCKLTIFFRFLIPYKIFLSNLPTHANCEGHFFSVKILPSIYFSFVFIKFIL